MVNTKPPRICVVGYGSIGRRHASNALRLGADVFFLRTGKAVRGRPLLPVEVEAVYDQSSVISECPDAVIVANPTHLHAETAMWAVQSGFDVLIEKPLSHDMSRLDQLHKLAAKQGTIVGVAHQMRFDRRLKEMKKILDEGLIGNVTSAHIEWGSHLPEWHPWEDYRNSYAANQNMGGGVTLTCSHELNTAQFLFGDVVNVSSHVTNLSTLELDADGCIDALLLHETGCVSLLHLDFYQRPSRRRIRAIGECGSLEWDFNKSKLALTVEGKSRSIDKWEDPYNYEEDYFSMMADFLNSIQNRTQPRVSLDEGTRTIQLARRLLESGQVNSSKKMAGNIA